MLQTLEISKKAYGDIVTGIGWLLNKSISTEEGITAMKV